MIDGGFTVSDVETAEFNGISGDVDTSTKTFGVTAFRCNPVDRSTATGALAIGKILVICIDSGDENVRITAVNEFTGRKTGDNTPTSLKPDVANTEILGEGTSQLTIGTRPFAKFFVST